MDCSIVIPTFNRGKFSKLISHNINSQTYPFIKEIIVADDGDNSERLVLDVPFSVHYYKVPRMSIGEKRNFLMSKASGSYIAHMDTDDFYNKDYLSTSIFNLIKSGKNVSGSSDMLLLDVATKTTYRQRCIYIHLLNEATMVYKKSFIKNNKFSLGNSSEGIGFLISNINDIFETPIDDIMVCLAHDKNTVDKSAWCKDKYKTSLDMSKYEKHQNLI